jgi:mRNA-degrading endonuclease RelE of RelBE toxin-antitoxin system
VADIGPRLCLTFRRAGNTISGAWAIHHGKSQTSMFEIEFTPEAKDDLKALKKNEQVEVIVAIETQLQYEPTTETRNRKRLRPNDVAEWELRVGKFRVLYNVDNSTLTVRIEVIGFKVGNLLFVRGKRREL